MKANGAHGRWRRPRIGWVTGRARTEVFGGTARCRHVKAGNGDKAERKTKKCRGGKPPRH